MDSKYTINPDLLVRYLANKASSEEIFEVERWMHENDISRSTLHNMLNPSDGVRLMLSLDAEKDWLKVNKQIRTRKTFFSPILKIAASLVVAMLVGIAAYQFFIPDRLVASKTIHNRTQEVQKVELEDGSVVYLNADASISYADNFLDERSLKLTGEGFFEVKRDESNPFTIGVQQCKVTVLGTSFSVNSDSSQIEVIVKTGKVELRSSQDERVVLEKNERGVYDRATASLTSMPNMDLNSFSWQSNILVFDNTPLDKVVRDIEKYFIKKIVLTGDLKTIPAYTSRFDHPALTEVLEEMRLVLPIEYSVSGETITIKILSE